MIHSGIYNQVMSEVDNIRRSSKIKVASVGSTSRLLAEFLVLPRRSYEHFECINFLVSRPDDASFCFKSLDGVVDIVLVDVEAKQNLDLMEIAAKHIRRSSIVAYKPNDASVEAADLLIRQHFQDQLNGKSILVMGAGNISTKLALRLCERNAGITLVSRDYSKARKIADGLNAILPKYSQSSIKAFASPPNDTVYDVLVSFVAADGVVREEMASLLKRGGIAVDGGINNFTPGFLMASGKNGVVCTRLDVRLGFVYSLLSSSPDISNFYVNVRGERLIENIRLIAGGIIGNRGDIIVDRIQKPTQIVGMANGVGGVLSGDGYSSKDKIRLERARDFLLSDSEEEVG
jgi:Glutamyl-tRNA reductase